MNTTTVPSARFDDFRAGRSYVFAAPKRVLAATTAAQVGPVLEQVQQAVASGQWAYGFLTYEAAPGLDANLSVREADSTLPLAWFALTDAPTFSRLGAGGGGRNVGQGEQYQLSPWELDWDQAAHAGAVAQVKEAIARGDTYQVNLTTRARSVLAGSPYALYQDLASRQRGAFCAYLDVPGPTGRWALASASPESFLEWDGEQVRSVPMKGTAPRSADPATDAALREELRASTKDTAENVMIVDLIRNDLARVARTGSVHVPALFACEAYPTVWQLTSTVAATARPEVGLRELLAAMFPCGSITGAPKKSTMELIAALETSPRGIYCGAIGFLGPREEGACNPAGSDVRDGVADGAGGFLAGSRGAFSVAIRTVAVELSTGRAEYGVGGGVTWNSTPAGEYAELLTKMRVLHGERDFGLVETFALTAAGPRHLERHLARLRASASALGFVYDAAAVAALLEREIPAALPQRNDSAGASAAQADHAESEAAQSDPARAEALLLGRLELRRDGSLSFTTRPAEPAVEVVRLALDAPDTAPVEFAAATRRHKTTQRAHYDAARARHPQADDVVLVNAAGQVTETTTANIAALVGGRWLTPALATGCLPGIGRQLALESGRVQEAMLSVADLRGAAELAVLSSARGWRQAVLLD
ncbi:MAG: aminodeoxychorismate synthase component I [Buchananella hordeovulneris]|nr:aminodeoxychorismate synthase component I [Buchananella hordeovulneris]